MLAVYAATNVICAWIAVASTGFTVLNGIMNTLASRTAAIDGAFIGVIAADRACTDSIYAFVRRGTRFTIIASCALVRRSMLAVAIAVAAV